MEKPNVVNITDVVIDNQVVKKLPKWKAFILRLINVKAQEQFSISINFTADDPYMMPNDLFMIARAGEELVFFVNSIHGSEAGKKPSCHVRATSVKYCDYPLLFVPEGIVVFGQAFPEDKQYVAGHDPY